MPRESSFRKVEKFGLVLVRFPLCFSRAPSDFRRPRARASVDCGRCMPNGPPEQSDLVRFIAEENKPQLVSLLLHAGERLPPGDDSAADHRAVLFTYLQRAPGHLLLALESFRAGDDVGEGVLLGDSARESRLDELGRRFPFARSSPQRIGSEEALQYPSLIATEEF